MAAVIELHEVTKTYGRERGVSNVSLGVEQGTIFGFLGPNGAGKTTTISMLVDLIRPTSGSISLFGLDSVRDSVHIRKRLGFLAGDFSLDEKLTGWQQLTYFAHLRGGVKQSRISELAKRLSCDLGRPIKTLSRGNRQKIGLISALMHDPELLVFDEPTSGLDPLIQAEFNAIVREYKKAGKTVFISSHALSEVQEICDQVAFIREGEIIAIKSIEALAAGSPKHLKIAGAEKKLRTQLQKLAEVQVIADTPASFDCHYTGNINKILNVLSKYNLKDVIIQEADLETIFMQFYSGDHRV